MIDDRMQRRRRRPSRSTDEELTMKVLMSLRRLLNRGGRKAGASLVNLKNSIVNSLRSEGAHISDEDIEAEVLETLSTARRGNRQRR